MIRKVVNCVILKLLLNRERKYVFQKTISFLFFRFFLLLILCLFFSDSDFSRQYTSF